MIIWKKKGTLAGNFKTYKTGDEVPEGLLSKQRIEEFEEKGWIEVYVKPKVELIEIPIVVKKTKDELVDIPTFQNQDEVNFQTEETETVEVETAQIEAQMERQEPIEDAKPLKTSKSKPKAKPRKRKSKKVK